jgi:gliding motility-associated-like protein
MENKNTKNTQYANHARSMLFVLAKCTGFFLILGLFLTNNELAAKSLSWKDSCSGLFIGRVINPSLTQDSVILVCVGDTVSIKDTSLDKLHNENISVRYRINGNTFINKRSFENRFVRAGDSLVEFEVSNDSGCVINTRYRIKILSMESDISVGSLVQCLDGNKFDFSLTHVNYGSQNMAISNVSWKVEGLLDTFGSSWNYTFNTADTFQICAQVTTAIGCVSKDTIMIDVVPSVRTQIQHNYDSIYCYKRGLNDTFVLKHSILQVGNSKATLDTTYWHNQTDVRSNDTIIWAFSPINNTYGMQFWYHTAVTDRGCTHTDSFSVYIAEPPLASFIMSDTLLCLGNSLNLVDRSLLDPKDPWLKVNYIWNGIDTIIGAKDTLKYSPNKIGDQIVMVQGQTKLGCKVTFSDSTLRVASQPEAVILFSKTYVCEGDTTSLKFETTTLKSGLNSEWYLNNIKVSSDSFYIFEPSKMNNDYGLKNLVYRLTNQEGCSDSDRVRVGIIKSPDLQIVRTNTDSCLKKNQRFVVRNKSAENAITKAIWSFEDNTKVYDTIVSKAFVKTGNNKIKVAATNNYGCTDSVERIIQVSLPPKARFTSSSLFACEDKQKFKFYDSSSTSAGSLVKATWLLSDGTKYTNPTAGEVSHTFKNSGVFLVNLVSENSLGCVDTFTERVQISAKPIADFSINNTNQCLNTNRFVFTNNSIANGTQTQLKYHWDFDDTTTSNNVSPVKSYKQSKVFRVTLTATNALGCSDSISQKLTVLGLPTARISLNYLEQCVDNQKFEFKDSSVNNSGSGSIIQREWNFGDNTTQTGISATKIFANHGTYQLAFFVRLSTGCYDSALQTLTVRPKPRSNFSVNKDTQCLTNNNFTFDNKSSIITGGGSLSYIWNFADTITSFAAHPSINFASYGDFKAKLKVSSQFGCADSFEIPLQVTANPLVKFTSQYPLSQCNNTDTFASVNTTSALNGRALRFGWRISDGSVYTTKEIGHSFQKPGSYQIVLTSTNSLGCSDSTKVNLSVFPDPKADYKVNQLQQCFSSQDFVTSNQSSIGFNGGVMSYKWFLGNDSIGNSTNANIKGLKIGNYSLKLVVKSSNSCVDSQTQTLVVLQSPKADFSVNDSSQCLRSNTFSLDNLSLNTGSNSTSQWLFGDGTGAQTKNAKKAYLKYGSYSITLIASTNQGCSDTFTSKVIVHSMPSVDFDINDTIQCLYGNKFKFKENSINDDNSGLSHTWGFEGNKIATGDSTTYSFSKSGIYYVKLTSKSTFGCVDSLFKLVRVNTQPTALFSVNKTQQCLSQNEFKFKNLATISNGKVLKHNWILGDGSLFSGTDTLHSYNSADTFTVVLMSTSSEGCSDTFTSLVRVNPQPVADFSTLDTGFCFKGNNVKFTNKSSIIAGTYKNFWSFGDGRTSLGVDPVNRYIEPNRFPVKLIVTSNLGCEDSILRYITIHPNPQNGFRLNQQNQCLNQNLFKFEDTTFIKTGTSSVFWSFGDGKTSNLSSITHVYDSIGPFLLTQVSTSNFGCIDTLRATVNVLPNPKSNYNINDSIQCDGDNYFEFENLTSIPKGKFQTTWNYGDGTVQSRFHGQYSFTSAGKYKVSQVNTSDQGCSDTISKIVTVTEIPQLEFVFNQQNQCEKYNNFKGFNTSVYGGSQTVNYFWDMGNGDTTYQYDLNYRYGLYGKYNVTLNGITTEGCVSQLTKNVQVYAQGVADFNLTDDSFCIFNNVVRFKNNSKVNGDRFAAFIWNFGDGNVRNIIDNNPLDYSYNSPGTFNAKLYTITQNLCKDTTEKALTIISMPSALGGVNQNIECFNQQNFIFKDLSNNTNKKLERHWIVNRTLRGIDSTLNFKFPDIGSNRASLVLVDDFGCSDTSVVNVNVLPSPKADFVVSKTEQCLEKNEYLFTDVSTGTNGKEGFWQPEPGSAGNDFDLNYVYYKSGIFKAKLTVYNNEGCSDSAVRSVIVNPTPEGTLSFMNTCVFVPTNITANAQISNGLINAYNWVLGDGTFTNEMDLIHTYNSEGRFPISVNLISDKGCQLYLFDTIDIYSKPEAKIGTITNILSINQPELDVYDESPDGPFASYEWNMGDGSLNVQDVQVKHTYKDTGWFTVALMVESFEGCLDTAIKLTYVAPEHRLLFPTAFSPNNDGINDQYSVLGKFHSIRAVRFLILNELGNSVFESNSLNESWNGTLNNQGDELQSGTYVVKVYLTDSYAKQFEYTQRINLIR